MRRAEAEDALVVFAHAPQPRPRLDPPLVVDVILNAFNQLPSAQVEIERLPSSFLQGEIRAQGSKPFQGCRDAACPFVTLKSCLAIVRQGGWQGANLVRGAACSLATL